MLTKRHHYRAIPKDAKIITRNGRRYARWTNTRGATHTRPLNETGDRIVCESRHWYVRLKDSDGKLLEWKAYTDKTASRALEVELFMKLERGEAGLLDPMGDHRKRSLTEHLVAFEAHLEAKDNTTDHIDRTVERCRKVFTAIKASVIGDITPGRVEACLASLRRDGLSVSSSNHYLRAVRNFSRWLVDDRRVEQNPIVGLKALKVSESDKKRRRRNMTDDEFAALIAATRGSDHVFRGLAGADRVMLYTLAATTGLRASELASLTPESFDLDSGTRTVHCLGGYTKNGEEAVLPLRSDVAEQMRDFLSGRAPGERLWSGSWARSRAGAAMIKADLEVAGVRYQDRSGRYADFHSLRHTFISNLARVGVYPKDAQALARHSTIDLTMNVYTHTVIGDLARAVESLPAVPVETVEVVELAATGTDGAAGGGPKRRTKRRAFSDSPCTEGTIPGKSWQDRPSERGDLHATKNPRKPAVLATSSNDCQPKSLLPEVGLEPTRPCGHGILNPARLPIPPLRRLLFSTIYDNLQSRPNSLGQVLGSARPRIRPFGQFSPSPVGGLRRYRPCSGAPAYLCPTSHRGPSRCSGQHRPAGQSY